MWRNERNGSNEIKWQRIPQKGCQGHKVKNSNDKHRWEMNV
jgi:hypothetical protein